jgi:integrase
MPFEFSRSRAPRTTQAYESVWKDFEGFCATIAAKPLPAAAETVIEFIKAREPTHSTSALSMRMAAIIAAHKDARAKLPKAKRAPYMLDNDDALKLGWKEIKRRKGNRHTTRSAVGPNELRLIFAQIPNTPAGIMDRAVLFIGLAIAMRRSEIAGLNRDDIRVEGDEMFVTIRRSKTDQNGDGVTLLAVRGESPDFCPIAAMERWLEASGIPDDDKGPLFRHPKFHYTRRIANEYTYLIVKRYGELAGFDPRYLGAHSLRVGFITTSLQAKVPLPDSMAAARHKTATVHLGYGKSGIGQENRAVMALNKALAA